MADHSEICSCLLYESLACSDYVCGRSRALGLISVASLVGKRVLI